MEPECIAAMEVKDGTTPKSIYPHDENETSLKAEISDPSVINDQVEDLDCNPIRDRESTRGEHLQPRKGVGTQLAYNIGVLGNNPRGVLGTKEGNR